MADRGGRVEPSSRPNRLWSDTQRRSELDQRLEDLEPGQVSFAGCAHVFCQGVCWAAGWVRRRREAQWPEAAVGCGGYGAGRAKHGQDDVASRASQADDSGVVPLTLSAFSGVEILGLRAAEGCERGEDMASLSRWFSRLDLASALRSLRDWRVAGASPA